MTWWRLYRFFAEGGELLYVGISRAPLERLVDHLRNQHWADEIARWERDPRLFADELEARAMERVAIKRGRPCYNVIHNDNPQRTRSEQAPRPARTAAPTLTSASISAILREIHPRSLTSARIGVELERRGAAVARTYRQDVLKLMRETGQLTQDGDGAYRSTGGCLVPVASSGEGAGDAPARTVARDLDAESGPTPRHDSDLTRFDVGRTDEVLTPERPVSTWAERIARTSSE
jgi:hypothetical protein